MAVKAWDMRGAEDVRELFLKKPALKSAARYGGSFLLGLAMGAARLLGGCGPFGVALAGAAGTELSGVLCLAGASVGYLLCGGLLSGVRWIAAMFLVFTAGLLARGTRLLRAPWFLPGAALLFSAMTGLLYRMDAFGGVSAALRLLTESALAAVCCRAFALALSPQPDTTEPAEHKRYISLALLGACALMSLTSVGAIKVLSVGRFLAQLIVMLTAFGGGPMLGCAVGASFGLAMDAAEGAALFFSAAYAFSALTAGALARRGRFAFSATFCLANAVAVLLAWSESAHVTALYECFAAAVVFMILPSLVVNPICALLRADGGRGEAAFRRYQAARLERMSDAFKRLYEVVRATAGPDEADVDVDAVFDRSSECVCAGCGNKELCWKMEYMDTLGSLRAVAEAMTARGTLREEDLPESFRLRCGKCAEFVGAVNGELRAMLYRRQYRARLRETKTAAYGQFADVASVLHTAAKELCGQAGPDAKAERRLGRFMKSVELDGSCSVFRDGRGRLRAVVESDGVEAFMQEPDWLERLSAVLGVRLSRLDDKAPGRLLLIQAEPLAVSVGIAAMKKEGESISGDRSSYFKTDAGLLCVILSDGMGTGAEAAVESSAAVKILEEFLRAGVDPGTAMRLLNAVVMLKNGDEWGYATVDLCCIDLFTGQTSFYKYGAAPTYVRTGRAIRRIKGRSLAAGMLAGEGSMPDMVRMRMRPGNVALIASDGVMAEDSDQWLRDILGEADGTEMKLLARKALKAAIGRFGKADDMTAMAIRVEERP